MATPATQNDLRFLATLCVVTAYNLGYIDLSNFGKWTISFDETGALEKNRLLGGTNSQDNASVIFLNPKLTDKNILSTIAHETIHVTQFMKGDIQNTDGVTQMNWRGEIFDLLPGDSPDYEAQPWEEEAYRLAPMLLLGIKRIPIIEIMKIWEQVKGSPWSIQMVKNFKNEML